MARNLSYTLSKIYGFIDILLIVFLIFDFGYENIITDWLNHKTLYLTFLVLLLIGFNMLRIKHAYKPGRRKMFKANMLVLVDTFILASIAFITGEEYGRLNDVNFIVDHALILYFFFSLTNIMRKLHDIYY